MSPPSVVSHADQDVKSSPIKDNGKIMVNGTDTDSSMMKASTKHDLGKVAKGPSPKSNLGKKPGLGVSSPLYRGNMHSIFALTPKIVFHCAVKFYFSYQI